MERHSVGDLFLPLFSQRLYDPFWMICGPLVIIGVVEQASDASYLGIAAVFRRCCPHDDFYGAGVREQR